MIRLLAIIAALLAGIILLVCFIRIRLNIAASLDPEEKSARLAILVGPLLIRAFHFYLKKDMRGLLVLHYYRNGKYARTFRLKDLLDSIGKRRRIKPDEVSDILDVFLEKRKLVIARIMLRLHVGAGDAASTAMLAGLSVSTVNTLLAAVYRRKGVPKITDIDIRPDFKKRVFELKTEFYAWIRLFHILAVFCAIFFKRIRADTARKTNRSGCPAQKNQST